MRILVFRGGALGDFLVTLPLLQALRSQWPGADLILVGNKRAASLAIDAGILTEAHSQDEARWAYLFAGTPLPPTLAGWLEQFDHIISFFPDPDGALQRAFGQLRRPTIAQYPASPEVAPAARHFCAPLAPLGIRNPDTLCLRLPIFADRKRLVVFHPGSGSVAKNWPAHAWRDLLKQLPGEVAAVASSQDEAALKGVGFPGPTLKDAPLSEVARLLASAQLYIGHDTGISHLAASVGTPSLLLFGPTEPAMWAPPAAHVHVIREHPLASLTVERVLARVQALLDAPTVAA